MHVFAAHLVFPADKFVVARECHQKQIYFVTIWSYECHPETALFCYGMGKRCSSVVFNQGCATSVGPLAFGGVTIRDRPELRPLEISLNYAYHTSRFSRDSPGLRALARRPGQSTKKSRLGIQSAIMNNMWSDNRNRMLEQNVKALPPVKLISTFLGVIFTTKYNRTKTFEKSMIGRMGKFTNAWTLFFSW